jgi:chromosome segregation ATPase
MAVEELREMKHVNAELEAKLRSRGNAVQASSDHSGGQDWESQKRRLLESLAADDRDDEDAVAERSTIEGTIRITDQVVAQKDKEIAELKQQLEQATSASSGRGAAAAELLDADEVIRQERERLLLVQAEWREKIGRAEIDISVERAKIGRDRIELEEKLRSYQTDQARRSEDTPTVSEAGGKPTRGRWLARLGLKELNDE